MAIEVYEIMESIEKLLEPSRPKLCDSCLGRMIYISDGAYRCEVCGRVALDDLGKVKRYLDKNGVAPISEIAEATKVSQELIELSYIDGKLEIPAEKIASKCVRCGKDLRSGRFCQDCRIELANKLKALYDKEV